MYSHRDRGGSSKSELMGGPFDRKCLSDVLDKHLGKSSPSTSRGFNSKDKERSSVPSTSTGKSQLDHRDSRSAALSKTKCSDAFSDLKEKKEEKMMKKKIAHEPPETENKMKKLKEPNVIEEANVSVVKKSKKKRKALELQLEEKGGSDTSSELVKRRGGEKKRIIETEEEEADFLSAVAAAEESFAKRRKPNQNDDEGACTAALKGSNNRLWQQISPLTTRQSQSQSQSRVAASTAAVSRGSDSEKSCPCGSGPCLVFTANTQRNRGRMFYKCPLRQESGGCGFFMWCDNDTPSQTNSMAMLTKYQQTPALLTALFDNTSKIPSLSLFCPTASTNTSFVHYFAR